MPLVRPVPILPILALTAMALGRASGAQQPTRKPGDHTVIIGRIVDDDEQAMAWGAPPPGEPHAPRTRAFDLQHQVVHVTFDWARRAVVGSTTLRVAALDRPLKRVTLDAVGMTIGGVRDADGAPLHYEYDGRVLAVTLPRALPPDGVATLTVDYEAVRPRAGVYFVERRHVVWTQGKLEDNRYWVPTYDFPNDKTTWELFVRTAPGERAWAVGALAGQRAVPGGIEWHWVQESPAPTYLMTVAVGPYATAEDSAHDTTGAVRLRYWAYPDSLDAARTGFAATPRAIDVLSGRLGVPFPERSFDQVVVPDFVFWDALEEWRPVIMTTVQDQQLVLRDAKGWPGETGELMVARAVAQQWFGRLVTPADWSQLWLGEGIANYLAQVYAEEVHGAAAARSLRRWSQVSAFAADRDARRPLVYDRWRYGPMELLLTEHAGQKGAVVLDMLRHEVGDSAFWAGMRRFVEERAGGTITTADFQRAMEEASGRELSTFFRQWVYGAGFPFVRVAYRYDSTARRLTLTATQYQRRDSLTGFFDASVDIEILTDSRMVRARLPLHGETSELALVLPAAPRSIRWDPDGHFLGEVAFEKPTEMLVYELEHHPEIEARADAARALHARMMALSGSGGMVAIGSDVAAPPPGMDLELLALLLRTARTDSSLQVRVTAIEGMASARLFSPEVTTALLDLTRDPNPAIRGSAAMALFGPPQPGVAERLAELAEHDPDAGVRDMALQALMMTAPESAAALEPPANAERAESDETKVRRLAQRAIGTYGAPGGWALAKRYATDPASSRMVRETAMRILGLAVFMSRVTPEGSPEELVALLTPYLSADDPSLRLVAAREMGEARIPAATAALEARKAVEVDARVLAQIDDSLRRIAAPDPMDDMR